MLLTLQAMWRTHTYLYPTTSVVTSFCLQKSNAKIFWKPQGIVRHDLFSGPITRYYTVEDIFIRDHHFIMLLARLLCSLKQRDCPWPPCLCHWWDLNWYDFSQCFKAWKQAAKNLIKAYSMVLEFTWTSRYTSHFWALLHINIWNNVVPPTPRSMVHSQSPWAPHICGYSTNYGQKIFRK